MKRKCGYRVLLILMVAVFIGTVSAQDDARRLDYRIGPQDLLKINEFQLDEFNLTVRVSEEGKITLPLLGEIHVEGMTKSEIEQKLSGLLEERYVQDAQVTVYIEEYLSKKVSVLGAVSNPKTYELLGRQTLLQIISEAGGLTSEAGNEIIVIRPLPDGSSTSLSISIDDLFVKGDPSFNIPLEPNDIINVPVNTTVKIYVFGQVNNPGALDVKRANIPTLLQAIAQAGGFTERAAKSDVLIKWKDENGQEHQKKVNVKRIIRGKDADVQLKENDVVFVREAIF